MMKQKIKEDKIENIFFSPVCIDRRKPFAIKSIQKKIIFRNLSHKNKIPLFSIIKPRQKRLNNSARKSGYRLQFLRQCAF